MLRCHGAHGWNDLSIDIGGHASIEQVGPLCEKAQVQNMEEGL
jgi:hypothetical protein